MMATHAMLTAMKATFARKVLSLAAATVLLAICSTGGLPRASAQDLTGKVFLILPDFFTVRFEQLDKPAFLKAMKELAPRIESESSIPRTTSNARCRRCRQRSPKVRKRSS